MAGDFRAELTHHGRRGPVVNALLFTTPSACRGAVVIFGARQSHTIGATWQNKANAEKPVPSTTGRRIAPEPTGAARCLSDLDASGHVAPNEPSSHFAQIEPNPKNSSILHGLHLSLHP
jgi:hypothetical protein